VGLDLLTRLDKAIPAAAAAGDAASLFEAFTTALEESLDHTCKPPTRPTPQGNVPPHQAAAMRVANASLRNLNLPANILALIQDAKRAPASTRHTLQRKAARALKQHHRNLKRKDTAELEALRITNSHAFFSQIKARLAPDDPTLHAPTSANSVPS
jgi:hypothetical protein